MSPLSPSSSSTHLLLVFVAVVQAARNRCYSCASSNMESNFLTKLRGPNKRIALPKVFDNYCNLDMWIIKEKSLVECDGYCFKWQQIVNNSGDFSYMTLRSCYNQMFDVRDISTLPPPEHAYCTSRQLPLLCLADAELLENSCWCSGDICNSSPHPRIFPPLLPVLIAFLARFVLLR